MARPRFHKLPRERRHQLLECAANEFARRGYQGASLNRIISDVGSSKGSFYYYFDDKLDLFDTVVGFAIDRIFLGGDGPQDIAQTVENLEEQLADLETDTFWPVLGNRFRELMSRVEELPWLLGLGQLMYNPPEVDGLEGLVARRFEQAENWLAKLLAHGRRIGAVRDDSPLQLQELMVAGALTGSDRWFVEHWSELEPEQRIEHSEVVYAAVVRMAASPALSGKPHLGKPPSWEEGLGATDG